MTLTVDAAHERAKAIGCKCDACPLRGRRLGPVLPTIVKGASLIAIGEAPGRNEIRQRQGFVGASGQYLNRGLALGGMRRDQVSISNAILCMPPGGDLRKFLKTEKKLAELEGREWVSPLDACRGHLWRDLRVSNAKTILTLGKVAYETIAYAAGFKTGKVESPKPGEKWLGSITEQQGHPAELPRSGKILVPAMHPAAAMRDKRHMLGPITDFIARAARIARRGRIDWAPPKLILFPSVEAIEQWCDRVIEAGAQITCDIETDSLDWFANIRCAGLGATLDSEESIIVAPLRHKDGRAWWSEEDETRVRAAVRRALDACPLLFHNGAFDTRHLIRYGLMAAKTPDGKWRTWDCSMLAHHNTRENDCPHSLAFVSSRAMEIPLWKADVDHKAGAFGGSDYDLHEYCGIDVSTTRQSWDVMVEWMRRDQTEAQYRVDRQLAPYVRNMSDLGLPVHLPTRAEFSRQLREQIAVVRKRLCSITGDPDFSAWSASRMRRYLFDRKGIVPCISTSGYEFKLGEDAATSIPALLAILDKRDPDDETKEFIDHAIKFKSLDKLRSTYAEANEKYFYPTPWDDWASLKATFNLHVVPSGRLSASPNVLNWPQVASINMRQMIVAPPGHVIVAADWSAVELRIYAVAANDQPLIDAFKRGIDAHTLNAATILSKSPDGIEDLYQKIMRWKKMPEDSEEFINAKFFRLVAKIFVFLLLYGGEESKLFDLMAAMRNKATGDRLFPNLAKDPVRGRARIHAMAERWHTVHPATKTWQANVAAGLRECGYVAEPIHWRKRYFPGGPSKKNAPPNHTIQARAAALANTKFIEVNEAIPHREFSEHSGVINFVYDEIVVVVPEDRGVWAAETMSEIMTHETPEMAYPAEAEVTRYWTGPDIREELLA